MSDLFEIGEEESLINEEHVTKEKCFALLLKKLYDHMVDENVDKQMLDYYFMGGFICGLKNTDI